MDEIPWVIEIESWIIPWMMGSVRAQHGFYIVPDDAPINKMTIRKSPWRTCDR